MDFFLIFIKLFDAEELVKEEPITAPDAAEAEVPPAQQGKLLYKLPIR